MNIYKISCFSDCGSYFASYLQSITVIAETQEDAIIKAKAWMDKEDNHFIREEKEWDITKLTEGLSPGVVDWLEDSDY